MKYYLITVVISLMAFLTIYYPVNGQEISLEMSPPKYTIVTKPDKTIPLTFSVENTGDPTIMKMSIRQIEKDPSADTIRILSSPENSIRFSLQNGIYQLDEPFLLKHNESLDVQLNTSIGPQTPETDYQYVFMAETLSPQLPEGEVSAGVHGTITSTLLFQVTTDAIDAKDFRITLLDIRPQFEIPFFGEAIAVYDTYTPVPVILRALNSAKHSVEIHGSLRIHNTFAYKRTVAIQPKRIFPDTEELINVDTNPDLYCVTHEESYVCKEDNTLILDNLPLGYYTISATVYDRNKSAILSKQTSFAIIPIAGIALGTGILVAFCVIGIAFIIQRKKIQTYLMKKRREKRRTSLRP